MTAHLLRRSRSTKGRAKAQAPAQTKASDQRPQDPRVPTRASRRGVGAAPHATDARLAALLHLSSDSVTIVSADGRIEYQNPASIAILANDPAELIGGSFEWLLHDDDKILWREALATVREEAHTVAARTWRLHCSDDTYVLAASTIRNLLNADGVSGIVVTTRALARRNTPMSAHSPGGRAALALESVRVDRTRLATRAEFTSEVESAIARVDPSQGGLVLVVAHVGFQEVGGHWEEISSDLETASGARLREALRRGETLAFLREHEFGILVERADERYARCLVDRVQSLLEYPFGTEQGDILVHASLGVAISYDPNVQVVDLLQRADLSRYRGDPLEELDTDLTVEGHPVGYVDMASSDGPHDDTVAANDVLATDRVEGVIANALGGCVVDNGDDTRPASGEVDGLAVVSGVRTRGWFVHLLPDVGAVERHELTILYRPIYELNTGEVVALETRPQWRQANSARALPVELASIDTNRDSAAIERWLLRTACCEVRALQDSANRPEIRVRIAVYPRRHDPVSLLDHVALGLGESGLAPENLVLEVPNSAANGLDPTTRSLVEGLKALGARVALADLDSDSVAADAPVLREVDELNVHCPRHFETRPHADGIDTGLPRLEEIASVLGLRLVVEDVDTLSQLTLVRQAGIRVAQGMILSKPIDASCLEAIWSADARSRPQPAAC